MMVAPGSVYSTFDMYTYYLDAFKKNEKVADCWGFSYHSVIEYHHLAREELARRYGIFMGSDADDIVRAAREVVLDIILRRPDVVFFIDGTKFPDALLAEAKRLVKGLNQKTIFACYMTEAPYINDVLLEYQQYFDVLFINDKAEVKRRNPDNALFIDYLPHSFSPLVHYPYDDMDDKYKHDVFFCGTLFPERANVLDAVDWTGIDTYIAGAFSLATDEVVESLKTKCNVSEETIPNKIVAEYYRGAKICLNLNRTYGWTPKHEVITIESDLAYSVGPRVIEAAACGAFIISEPRPELQELFGDSIPTFTNAKELEELIRYYLEHEEERKEKARKSTEIAQSMTYDQRSDMVVDTLISALNLVGRL